MDWFEETLWPDWAQRMPVTKVLYRDKTEHQDLVVFETPRWGRVLALDGVVQTTTADEFVYHEMLVHVPVLAHGDARDLLIIVVSHVWLKVFSKLKLHHIGRDFGLLITQVQSIDGTMAINCLLHPPQHGIDISQDRLNESEVGTYLIIEPAPDSLMPHGEIGLQTPIWFPDKFIVHSITPLYACTPVLILDPKPHKKTGREPSLTPLAVTMSYQA